MRGLSVGDTLTLIDGERMVSYPLSDDGERSFVDVTAIPFNAIESVEVLKDGASAVYGADAIAGVVNIKLKKTYVGSELTMEAGTTQYGDGTTEHGAGIFGIGDLSNDGYNFYVGARLAPPGQDFGSQSQRCIHDHELVFAAGRREYPTRRHRRLRPRLSGQHHGLPDQPDTGEPNAFLPGCDQASQNADKCTFAFPGKIQSPTTQINLLSKFTKALSNDWTATITGSVFDSSAQQIAATTFGHAFNNTGQEAGGIVNITGSPGQLFSTVVVPHALPAGELAAEPVREHLPAAAEDSVRIWFTAFRTSDPIRSTWIPSPTACSAT